MKSSFYCCLPDKIYSIIQTEPCNISIKGTKLDIINKNTNEVIVSLHYGPKEERTEIVFVDETSIETTMPINQVIEITKKTDLRSKSKNIKPKEKIQLDTIPPFEINTPIATLKNFSDKKLLKEHIQATLDYIGDNYSSDENKLSALSELARFVTSINSIKNQTNLQNSFEALKESKRKKNIPEIKRALLVISNKI